MIIERKKKECLADIYLKMWGWENPSMEGGSEEVAYYPLAKELLVAGRKKVGFPQLCRP